MPSPTKRWESPRKALPTKQCRYCRAKFRPTRNTQRFCKPDHRKAFFRYGGLPYDKLRDQMRRDIAAELAPLREAIQQIEERQARHAADIAELRTVADKLAAIAGI